jgi:hypothetical protein
MYKGVTTDLCSRGHNSPTVCRRRLDCMTTGQGWHPALTDSTGCTAVAVEHRFPYRRANSASAGGARLPLLIREETRSMPWSLRQERGEPLHREVEWVMPLMLSQGLIVETRR